MRTPLAQRITSISCRWLILLILPATSCRRVDGPAAVSEPPEVVVTKGGVEMVLIPAGRFQMGSDRGEADQSPVHQVWVDAFLIDRHEVTQKQWARLARDHPFLGNDPAHFKGPDRPVEMVSWDQAALYCNQRSRDEGRTPCYDEETGRCRFEADGYRLPTEAEWEYACRAGSRAEYCFGGDGRRLAQYAWYAANAGKQTHPVGRKKPNAWGLYDMHGNVAEWCNDPYDKDYYRVSPQKNPRGPAEADKCVLRGGAWTAKPQACRSAARLGEDPGVSDACFARDAIGFRCVRRAPPAGASRTSPGGPPSP